MPRVEPILLVYVAGVIVGVWRVDAPPLARVAVAATWPLGLVAAVVTTVVLLLSAGMLFPLVGAGMGAALVAGWWLAG
jgi:hypothetical protein